VKPAAVAGILLFRDPGFAQALQVVIERRYVGEEMATL